MKPSGKRRRTYLRPAKLGQQFTIQRDRNRESGNKVEIKLVTRVPDKWLVIDMETGELYHGAPSVKGGLTKVATVPELNMWERRSSVNAAIAHIVHRIQGKRSFQVGKHLISRRAR